MHLGSYVFDDAGLQLLGYQQEYYYYSLAFSNSPSKFSTLPATMRTMLVPSCTFTEARLSVQTVNMCSKYLEVMPFFLLDVVIVGHRLGCFNDIMLYYYFLYKSVIYSTK
ncbi:unnamed protein product [Heterosigma akashiwo]